MTKLGMSCAYYHPHDFDVGEDLLWTPPGLGPKVWPPTGPLTPHRVWRPVRYRGTCRRCQGRHSTHQQIQQ